MDAISEAVTLLRQRRDENVSRIDELTMENNRIDDALTHLGASVVGEVASATPLVAATVPTTGAIPRTIKEQVMTTLLSEARPWSLDEIADALRGSQHDRTDAQFRGTIRTALWSLRGEERVSRVGQKRNIASEYADAVGDADDADGQVSFSELESENTDSEEVSTS